jgi:hypothetical protein
MSQNHPQNLTIVLDIVDLDVVPLMRQSLCIKLHPIIVLALLQEMRVEGCDIDNIPVKVTTSDNVSHFDL